jgi:phosphonopyruvate decarboxylase
MSRPPNEQRMALAETVDALRSVRRDDEVVVSSMGVAREWMKGSPHPLDLVYVPSSMGQATSIGLGLALARPERRVIVCNGDGSMLMNLGSLVSITAANPSNLVVLVFDNGVYEITGAQPTPGSSAGRESHVAVDFAGVARACGFHAVHRISDLGQWRQTARAVLDDTGPVFAVLDVAPVAGASGPRSPGPGSDRASAFMAALGHLGILSISEEKS